MVDVTHGADVHVGLGALELLLGHRLATPCLWSVPRWPRRCLYFLFLRLLLLRLDLVRSCDALGGARLRRSWVPWPGPAGYSPCARAMISLEIDSGTSLYESNCIVYVARPCVRERRSVA